MVSHWAFPAWRPMRAARSNSAVAAVEKKKYSTYSMIEKISGWLHIQFGIIKNLQKCPNYSPKKELHKHIGDNFLGNMVHATNFPNRLFVCHKLKLKKFPIFILKVRSKILETIPDTSMDPDLPKSSAIADSSEAKVLTSLAFKEQINFLAQSSASFKLASRMALERASCSSMISSSSMERP